MQDEAFSSIDIVSQCLIDEPRSLAFEEAIKKVIVENDVVIDIGTGSGIMALFSARAGAKEVYALEYDNYIAKIAENNFKNNGFNNIKKIFVGDARSFKYPKGLHFDVVVMEMLTTGMVDEYQIEAINNLHQQKIVSSNSKFIPKIQKTYASLANSKSSLYGFKFKMVTHLWNNLSQNLKVLTLSDPELVNSIDFSKINNEINDSNIRFIIKSDGLVNGILLTSETLLTDLQILKDTETLNAPVFIPIDDINVKKGDILDININYKFGGGYNNFKVKLI